jgi:hypothetical protein
MIRSKLALTGLAALAISACAGPQYYQGPMSAAYEVPPKPSQAVGTVVGVYYPTTHALTWTVQYKDLTGPATAAHIHGPAAPGANAPVVIPATVTPSPITGGATLTDAQAADLTAGLYYFNIHTAANPGGEMRGQMLPAK